MSSFSGSTETSQFSGAYSARVRLYVVVGGQHIPLAQVGGNRLYFAEPTSLPAGPAELVVEVDGESQAWPIAIPPSAGPSDMIECLDR